MSSLTESVNPRTGDIDTRSIPEILTLMNQEDLTVAEAVKLALPEIADAVQCIVDALSRGGRLIYTGAGTSGRLGILDASECPPTFSTPPGLVTGVIAGGPDAVFRAAEGAEDSFEAGVRAMEDQQIKAEDVVVGLSANGNAPYVAGTLSEARRRSASTIALLCNETGAITEYADHAVRVLTGPEIIAGSTRLKAGTAQKMVLNMFTTATMIRLGKVTGNFMTDMKPTNRKLRRRAVFILCSLTGWNEEKAETVLEANGYNIRQAVLEFRKNSGETPQTP